MNECHADFAPATLVQAASAGTAPRGGFDFRSRPEGETVLLAV